jgi:hypothetical protein
MSIDAIERVGIIFSSQALKRLAIKIGGVG